VNKVEVDGAIGREPDPDRRSSGKRGTFTPRSDVEREVEIGKREAVPSLAVVALLLLSTWLTAGCPRVISLDYIPSNPLKGHGRLQVETFEYRAPQQGVDRPKKMQADAEEFEAFYLSQNIGDFFTQALKSELDHSGYEVAPTEALVITGTVERFYFDYEGPDGQVFEIHVSYRVNRSGAVAYSYTCESRQAQSAALSTSGLVIRAGIKHCIERFIQEAQNAKVL
jgi:hypothetical protein